MSIGQTFAWGIKQLKKSKIPSIDAEILLSYVLKKDKAWLFSNLDKKLTPKQFNKYKNLISRRREGEPTTYITGHKEFFGLDFYIDKSVLIPRPETELLVEVGLKISKFKNFKILDIGTGSGCIIISLAVNSKQLTVNSKYYATDISVQALKTAQKNAQKHKVKINFIKSNLFAQTPSIKFDLVIANLPYLDPKWISKDLKYEPICALDGGKNGLKIIKKFLIQAKKFLSKNGVIILEIDPRQTRLIKRLAKEYLLDKKITLIKDLSGLNRIVILKTRR